MQILLQCLLIFIDGLSIMCISAVKLTGWPEKAPKNSGKLRVKGLDTFLQVQNCILDLLEL